jgi:hypothetical protein
VESEIPKEHPGSPDAERMLVDIASGTLRQGAEDDCFLKFVVFSEYAVSFPQCPLTIELISKTVLEFPERLTAYSRSGGLLNH